MKIKINFFDEGYLKVSLMHQIFYRQYGNPLGEPIVWLHGGPGTGCQYNEAQFFDLAYFRVIVFDQRGAGKSRPFCELKENTTQDLVSDIELLRNYLGIEKWSVIGGSWGTLLAICYAIAYPENIKSMILRGVFLGTHRESRHLWYGMRDTFPDAWQAFYTFLPEKERVNLRKSYCTRILHSDEKISLPAIDAFEQYDCICASHQITIQRLKASLNNKISKIGCAKLFCYYDAHGYFLKPHYILDNLHRIQDLPCIIIHGRYDMICQVSVAYDLHQLWKNSRLYIIPNAGHTMHERAMSLAIRRAIKDLQKILKQD